MRTALALMVTPFSRSRSIVSSTWRLISRGDIVPVTLQQAVGQRRLAVVNVGNDAEIANLTCFHRVILDLSLLRGTVLSPARRCPPHQGNRQAPG